MPHQNRLLKLLKRKACRSTIQNNRLKNLCHVCRPFSRCQNIFSTASHNNGHLLKEYYKLVPLKVMNREVGYYSTEVKQKLQLGYDAFHQENFELAIQYFGDVLKDNPGLAQALLGLSVSCFFMGDYQNACRYMGYCIEKRPSGVVTEMAENFMDLCVGHCDIPNMAAATNNIQHL